MDKDDLIDFGLFANSDEFDHHCSSAECAERVESSNSPTVSFAHLMDMENNENYRVESADDSMQIEDCCFIATVSLSEDEKTDDENSVTPTPVASRETSGSTSSPTKVVKVSRDVEHNFSIHHNASSSPANATAETRTLLVDDDELEFYVDLAVHESQRWLEALTRIRYQGAVFLTSLTDGKILCKALNTIWPGITANSNGVDENFNEGLNSYFHHQNSSPVNSKSSDSSLAIFRATCIDKLCINALDVLHRELFTTKPTTTPTSTNDFRKNYFTATPKPAEQVDEQQSVDNVIAELVSAVEKAFKQHCAIEQKKLQLPPDFRHERQENLSTKTYENDNESDREEIYELDNQANLKISRSRSNLIRVVINIYLIGVLAQECDEATHHSVKFDDELSECSTSRTPLKSALPRLDLSAFTQLYRYYLRFVRPHLIAVSSSSASPDFLRAGESANIEASEADPRIMPVFHAELAAHDNSVVKANNNVTVENAGGSDELDDSGPDNHPTLSKSTTIVMSNRDHEMFVLMQKESVSGTMSPSFASSTLSTSSSSCSHSAVLPGEKNSSSPPASSAAASPPLTENLNVIVETVNQKQHQQTSSYTTTTSNSLSDEEINDSELDGTEDDLLNNTSPHPGDEMLQSLKEDHEAGGTLTQHADSLYISRTAITTTTTTTKISTKDHRRTQSDSAAEEDSLNSYDDAEPETPKHDAQLQQHFTAAEHNNHQDECVGTEDDVAPLETTVKDSAKRFHRELQSRTSNTSLISNASSLAGGGGKVPLAAALLTVRPDPLQFIKADPTHNVPRVIHDSRTTYEQAQQLHAKLREEELEWESNLDNWKSRRRSTKDDGDNNSNEYDDECGDHSPSSSQIRKFADIQADREHRRMQQPHERYRGIDADLLQKGVSDSNEQEDDEFRATQSDDEFAARQAAAAAITDDVQHQQPFGDSTTQRSSLRETVSRSSLPNVSVKSIQKAVHFPATEKPPTPVMPVYEKQPEVTPAATPVVVEKKLGQRISMLVAARASDVNSSSLAKPVVVDTVPQHAPSNPDIVMVGIPFHQKLSMFRATSDNNDAIDSRSPNYQQQQRALSTDRSHVPTKKLFHIVPEGENEIPHELTRPLAQPTGSGRSSSLSAQGGRGGAGVAEHMNKKISHWLARDAKNNASLANAVQQVTTSKPVKNNTTTVAPSERISGATNISSGANTVTFDFTKPPTQFVKPPPPAPQQKSADSMSIQREATTVEQIKTAHVKETVANFTSSPDPKMKELPTIERATPPSFHAKQLSENNSGQSKIQQPIAASSSLAGSSTSLLTTTSSGGSNNSAEVTSNAESAAGQSTEAVVVKKPKKKVIVIDLNEIERQKETAAVEKSPKAEAKVAERQTSTSSNRDSDVLLTPVAPTFASSNDKKPNTDSVNAVRTAEALDREEVEDLTRYQGELAQSLELEAERWKRRIEQPPVKVEYRKITQQQHEQQLLTTTTSTVVEGDFKQPFARKTEQQPMIEFNQQPPSIMKQAAAVNGDASSRLSSQQKLDAKRKPQTSLLYADGALNHYDYRDSHPTSVKMENAQQKIAGTNALKMAEQQRQWLIQEEAELRRQEQQEEETIRRQVRNSITAVAPATAATDPRRLRSNGNGVSSAARPQSQYVYSGAEHERILMKQRTLQPAAYPQPSVQQQYGVQDEYRHIPQNTPQMRQRSVDMNSISSNGTNSASYRHSYHSQVSANGNGHLVGGGGDVLSLAPSYNGSTAYAPTAEQQIYAGSKPHLYQYEQPYGSIAAAPAPTRMNGAARNNAHRNATIYNDTVDDGSGGDYAIDYNNDERMRNIYDLHGRTRMQQQQPASDHHARGNGVAPVPDYAVVPARNNIMPNGKQHYNPPSLLASNIDSDRDARRQPQRVAAQKLDHQQQVAAIQYSQRHQQPIPLPHASSYDTKQMSAPKHTVSGSKLCSHCQMPLGKGAAMVVGTLNLYYHVKCFRCSVCGISLGSGLEGADVRVRNYKLHCSSCYSDEDGILQSVI